jgi:hypothetical protein
MRSYGNGGAAVGGRVGCEVPTQPFRRPASWPVLQRGAPVTGVTGVPSPAGRGLEPSPPAPAAPPAPAVPRQRTRGIAPKRSRKHTKQALARAASVAILQAQGQSVQAIAERLGISPYAVRQAAALIVPVTSSARGAR